MKTADFYGYKITENGEIYGLNGELRIISPRHGRYDTKFYTSEGMHTYSLARVIYASFNKDFDIKDKNQCISFKDGDRLNICLDNLVCIYRGDLVQGVNNILSKLSNEQVEEIRTMYAETNIDSPLNQYTVSKEYNSLVSLAKKYNVSRTYIRQIIKHKARDKKNYKLPENK